MCVTAQRKGEQQGTDGMGVIRAQDEREKRETMRNGRKEEGSGGSQIGDKISEGCKDKEAYKSANFEA